MTHHGAVLAAGAASGSLVAGAESVAASRQMRQMSDGTKRPPRGVSMNAENGRAALLLD